MKALLLIALLVPLTAFTNVTSASTAGLQFDVSIPKSQFSLTEPVPLTMNLINVSSGPMTVNSRLAVNDAAEPPPFREVTLTVNRLPLPGINVPFRWDVTIDFPDITDFQELAPAGYVQSTVDLADLYTLGPGEYDVCATYENQRSGPLVYNDISGEFEDQDVGAVQAVIGPSCVQFTIGPVGGTTELVVGRGGSFLYAAIAGGILAAVLALGGGWYVRRRWLG